MRRFSRWMPPAPKPRTRLISWVFLVALILGLIAAAVKWPGPVSVIGVAVVVLVIAQNQRFGEHLRWLAEERPGEDIGTFARAFNRRDEPFDPWVVRAAWDALQSYVGSRNGHFPLRPADRLQEDLWIDPEDWVESLVPEVAARAGYSLDQPESNPLFGRVNTVGDLVRFITLQPKDGSGAR
jgi:hypothetical protein